MTNISGAEWDVMNVIWGAPGPIRASEVVDALATKKDWSPRTVKTLLNRLVRKKVLDFEAVGKSYLYRPRLSREQCVRAESRSFLSRVFGGAAGAMLAHFVEQADLSPEEIKQLKKILDQKKGK